MPIVISVLASFWRQMHAPLRFIWMGWIALLAVVSMRCFYRFAECYREDRRRAAIPGVQTPLWVIAWKAAGEEVVSVVGILGVLLLAASLWDVLIISDIGKKVDRVEATNASGRDKSGRSATYKLVLLSAEYFWKYGSSTSVVNSAGDEIPIEQKLSSAGITGLVNRTSDVIAVGTASCIGRQEEEDSRAYDRARTLISWLRQVALAPTVEHLYLLNLGQYDRPCGYGPREREQRMVLIVGVSQKQPGVDIQESFRDALEHAPDEFARRLGLGGYINWPESRFRLELSM